MRKGPGRHDTWFRVICIWNHLLKMAPVIGFSFKEWFLRFQLLFLNFYNFHHVIWRMKWAKKLKTKNGQNMWSGPFSHDAAQVEVMKGLVSKETVLPRGWETGTHENCTHRKEISKLTFRALAFRYALRRTPNAQCISLIPSVRCEIIRLIPNFRIRVVFKWLSKNQNQSNYYDQTQQEQTARRTNHNS